MRWHGCKCYANRIMCLTQAMKVENMVKLKEEFDYKSLCRRLETELDRLVAENERQSKAREDNEDECARRLDEARQTVFEAESRLATALEVCYIHLPYWLEFCPAAFLVPVLLILEQYLCHLGSMGANRFVSSYNLQGLQWNRLICSWRFLPSAMLPRLSCTWLTTLVHL